MTKTPHSYAVGNGSMMEFSEDAAFWVFNQISNFAYTRYDVIHPEIEALQQEMENKFVKSTPAIDNAAKELYTIDKSLGIAFITDYSINQANNTVERWQEMYKYLFTKYMDGNIKAPVEGQRNPSLEQPGYSQEWYDLIKDDKLKVKGDAH